MKLLTPKKIKLFLLSIFFFYALPLNAETMILSYIEENGSFVFTNGTKAFLNDIWLQDDGIKYLQSNLSYGSKLDLELAKTKTNRYGNLVSYISYNGKLLQQELLQEGLALFYASSNDAENLDFIAFELSARNAQKGFWQNPKNIKNIDDIKYYHNDKALVTGKIHHLKKGKNKSYINFGKDYKKSFSIEIDNNIDIDFSTLDNKTILARGFVRKYHSPFISITNPLHLEVLEK